MAVGLRTAAIIAGLLLLGLAALFPASVDGSAIERLRHEQEINRALLAELNRALDRLEGVVARQTQINADLVLVGREQIATYSRLED